MHNLHRNLALLISATICIGFSDAAIARDQVKVAGSSTVLPYAKIVAERFAKTFTTFKMPLVELRRAAQIVKRPATLRTLRTNGMCQRFSVDRLWEIAREPIVV